MENLENFSNKTAELAAAKVAETGVKFWKQINKYSESAVKNALDGLGLSTKMAKQILDSFQAWNAMSETQQNNLEQKEVSVTEYLRESKKAIEEIVDDVIDIEPVNLISVPTTKELGELRRTVDSVIGKLSKLKDKDIIEDVFNTSLNRKDTIVNAYYEDLQKQSNLAHELEKTYGNLAYLQSSGAKNMAGNTYILEEQSKLANLRVEDQKLLNTQEAFIAKAEENSGKSDGHSDLGDLKAVQYEEQERAKTRKKLEEENRKAREKAELNAVRRLSGENLKLEMARIQRTSAEKLNAALKNVDQETKKRHEAELQAERIQEAQDERKQAEKDRRTLLGAGVSIDDRKNAFKDLTQTDGEFDKKKTIGNVIGILSDLAKNLENQIDSIASKKGAVDTRLQGSSNKQYWATGSYWDQITRDIMSVGAITPFFKQETFADNIAKLVDTGIAFDLEQRAFLETIKNKIATTFDTTNGTLLRLIRIQQEDSTAGRLGMESVLNTYLNNMYENTEYLKTVADSVRGSLEEMESLMSGAAAAEVEYQVQKWMGSLYSVGMSQSAVQSIVGALGQIGAGQIEGISNNGAGNLLIMAANDAGLSIAEMLTDGLNASDSNKLLQAAVNYLAELAESSKDNKVVQQQLANVFGVKASDLRAATNLVQSGSVNSIFGNELSYNNMIGQLYSMANTLGNRTSVAEKMQNLWQNASYSVAESMASNPVLYFIYKAAKAVDDLAGGIDLPTIFGSGLNTSVSELMRVGSLGLSLLSTIAPMASGFSSSFSGQAMLAKMGIKNQAGLIVTPRGDGENILNLNQGGGRLSTSISGYAGNASGSDIRASVEREAKDTKEQLMVEAKEEEKDNQIDSINIYVMKIYELLDDVTSGSKSLNVNVGGYGLTKSTSRAATAGIEGISSSLLGSSSGSSLYGSYSSFDNSSFAGSRLSSSPSTGSSYTTRGSASSGGSGGSVDFGSWTQT